MQNNEKRSHIQRQLVKEKANIVTRLGATQRHEAFVYDVVLDYPISELTKSDAVSGFIREIKFLGLFYKFDVMEADGRKIPTIRVSNNRL